MTNLFLNRIFRAIKIDIELFEEVEKDKKATLQAGTVVVLSKLFGGIKTKSNHSELLRTIGFSSAPGLIRVFGVTPELMTVTFIGSAFWMLACMIVAVKTALDYESLWKAFGVVVVSWLFQAFFLFLVIVLFKGI